MVQNRIIYTSRVSWALTGGALGAAGQLPLRGVAAPGDPHGLLHHVDAVALHQLLQQVEDLLCSGALEGKNPCQGQRGGLEQQGSDPALKNMCCSHF